MTPLRAIYANLDSVIMIPCGGNTVIFHSRWSQSLERRCVSSGSLAPFYLALYVASRSTLHRYRRTPSVWHAKCGGPMTPLRAIYANLDSVFIENIIVFIEPKEGGATPLSLPIHRPGGSHSYAQCMTLRDRFLTGMKWIFCPLTQPQMVTHRKTFKWRL